MVIACVLTNSFVCHVQARLKYLVNEWGIDKFRSVVEQYMGKKFQAFHPLPEWKFMDYLGWHEQGDGKLFYGVYIQNGRLKGEAKKALRAVIERYELPVTLSANQNILLRDVEPAWQQDIQATLEVSCKYIHTRTPFVTMYDHVGRCESYV